MCAHRLYISKKYLLYSFNSLLKYKLGNHHILFYFIDYHQFVGKGVVII